MILVIGMEEKKFYVYILASKKYGFLYTGITSNILKRTWEHKNSVAEGHTKKYSIK
jgi:putative endonuclease